MVQAHVGDFRWGPSLIRIFIPTNFSMNNNVESSFLAIPMANTYYQYSINVDLLPKTCGVHIYFGSMLVKNPFKKDYFLTHVTQSRIRLVVLYCTMHPACFGNKQTCKIQFTIMNDPWKLACKVAIYVNCC